MSRRFRSPVWVQYALGAGAIMLPYVVESLCYAAAALAMLGQNWEVGLLALLLPFVDASALPYAVFVSATIVIIMLLRGHLKALLT